MSLTTKLKDFTPPILVNLIKKILSYRKTYNSYDAALQASSSSLGYEDQYLINAIYEETKEYILSLDREFVTYADQTILHTLIPFTFISQKDSLNVIDIGGASGMHYFPIKKVLGNKFKFNWCIVETGALTKISKNLENEELKFFSNLSEAAKYLKTIDVIIASGAIQYFENPYKILKEITQIGAEYILLTRLSLTLSDKEIISVQKSLLSQNSFEKLPTGFRDRIIMYPHTTMKESKFKSIIQTNYTIKLHIEDDSGSQKINNNKCIGYGLLLHKNSR